MILTGLPDISSPAETLDTGPTDAHLDRALALVTVSSTAMIEAVGRGAALTLTGLGVSRGLINDVFVGTGTRGDGGGPDRRTRRVRQPEWRDDNYFHPPAAVVPERSGEPGSARAPSARTTEAFSAGGPRHRPSPPLGQVSAAADAAPQSERSARVCSARRASSAAAG